MVSNKEISEKLKARREGKHLTEDKPAEKIVIKSSKKCPECGKENKEDAKFCVGCGKSFEEKSIQIKPEDIENESDTKTCSSCGSEIPENAKFCVVCGETQPETTEEPLSSEKTPDKPVIGAINEPEEISVKPIKIVIQEIILDNEGLKLNENVVIEGLNNENELIKYENVDSIELKDETGLETIEIKTIDGSIKIKGVNPDSGQEFVSYAQKKVEEAKPSIDEESMDKIKKAQDLLDIGAIDEEEFGNIKRKIIEKSK